MDIDWKFAGHRADSTGTQNAAALRGRNAGSGFWCESACPKVAGVGQLLGQADARCDVGKTGRSGVQNMAEAVDADIEPVRGIGEEWAIVTQQSPPSYETWCDMGSDSERGAEPFAARVDGPPFAPTRGGVGGSACLLALRPMRYAA